MPIEFDSDLTIAVGDVEGRLVADGSALTLRTDNPVAFLDAARASLPGGNRGVGAVAEHLRREGVGIAVTGPKGESVAIGAPVGAARDSGRFARLTGRLATGSSDVIIERPQAFLALAPPSVRYVTYVGIGVAVLMFVRLLRRGGSSD